MLVLGIESTCDETACSIVRDGQEILSNIVSSQIDLHKEYGGVVPELACRRHIDVIIPVIEEALTQANLALQDIDLIAVAKGPGLIGALLIGLNAGKSLALTLNKPLIGVNHIEAHLYAAMMSSTHQIPMPSLGVVLSGGHTSLIKIENLGTYALIGQTVDDAIGEAFDKVAKILKLPYPGGPHIESLALEGNPNRYPLKAGQMKGKPYNFSFSGLKTGVLYTIRGQNNAIEESLSDQDKKDIAASFQETAFSDVVKKTLMAAESLSIKSIVFGGGVTNNQRLRAKFEEHNKDFNFFWPSKGLSLDNAAMIAGLGYHVYNKQGKSDPLTLEPSTRIAF